MTNILYHIFRKLSIFRTKANKKETSKKNASMKGGEIMRAIDILFNEIDKINSQIKLEENMHQKVFLAFKMGKIVEIIDEIEKLRIQIGDDKWI